MPPRVAIIGAGPAGTALALHLVRRGIDPADLVVYDRARFPRPKLCGGALTHRGTEALTELIGEPPGNAKTLGIEFRSSVGHVEVFERGVQWIYDRAELDHALLRAVMDAGVEVHQEHTVTGLEPAVDGWRVSTSAGSETYRWVAGADGACGISRRASGLAGGITGRLVEAVFEPTGSAPDPSRLVFDFDPVLDGIPGYAWIFPYPDPSQEELRTYKIGIMDGRGKVSGSVLREWTLRFAERNGFSLVDDKLAGWPERYFDRGVRGHRPGLVLVGEAYGIDALLGEGIAPVLYHAAYVAERLADALRAGRDRIPRFDWDFLWTPEGKNLWFQARLADLIYGPRGPMWMRVLFDLPRLRALAGAGADDYGRLARHIPSLSAAWVHYLMTRGFPSNDTPPPPQLPASSARP